MNTSVTDLNTSMTERKFYKTVFKVTVLSEEPLGNPDLEQIKYMITEGDCSGVVVASEALELDGKQAVRALYDIGSEPGFFRLTSKGEDCE